MALPGALAGLGHPLKAAARAAAGALRCSSRPREEGPGRKRSLRTRLPPRPAGAVLDAAWLLAALLPLVSCSLADPRSRPDPGAAENVSCLIDYLGAESDEGGPDLYFLAWSEPYDYETFFMSLPDVAFHTLFAPGRRLRRPLVAEGADCPKPWRKGFRLPRLPVPEKVLRCRRRGLEAVRFEVVTKWGRCAASLPAGDPAPRMLPWTTARNWWRPVTEPRPRAGGGG